MMKFCKSCKNKVLTWYLRRTTRRLLTSSSSQMQKALVLLVQLLVCQVVGLLNKLVLRFLKVRMSCCSNWTARTSVKPCHQKSCHHCCHFIRLTHVKKPSTLFKHFWTIKVLVTTRLFKLDHKMIHLLRNMLMLSVHLVSWLTNQIQSVVSVISIQMLCAHH